MTCVLVRKDYICFHKLSYLYIPFALNILSLNVSAVGSCKYEAHTINLDTFQKMITYTMDRLVPFRPLFPCVPWSRGTNNITLK